MSSVSSSTFTSMGIGSGLDLNTMLDQLMSIERTSQNKLKTSLTKHQSTVTNFQTLNTKFAALRTNADALSLGLDWKTKKATSSDSSVSATAVASALSGNLSFKVLNLATAQTAASYGTVSSTSSVVGTGSLMIGQTSALGIGSLSATGMSNGSHTIAVTQASAGATVNGTPLSDSITIAGGETLEFDLNGTPSSITLTAGTYGQKELAAMVSNASNGKLNVKVNSDRSLSFATKQEGSVTSLAVTGGTGLAKLGLTAGQTGTGVDGKVTVDGVETVVSDIRPDGSNTVVLPGTAGSITASFSNGLRLGTSTVKNVDLDDGKLSTVVEKINASKSGVIAAAIQVAPGQYKLQLTSSKTGVDGAISTNLDAFTSTLGRMQTITAAKDANLQVGDNSAGYTITSATNTVTDAMPGVTISLMSADPSKTVTIGIGADADALATKVQKMLDSVNEALTFIKDNSKYDASTKTGGFFQGNSTTSRLQQSLFSAVTSLVDRTSLNSGVSVGIKTDANGLFTLDTAAFKAAFSADPEAVAGVFVEGGSTSVTTYTKPGISERLEALAKQATDSVSGVITTVIKGENSTIADLTKQISSWDLRLEKRQAMLKAQFTALDTAIAGFKSQGDWLTGALSSLNGS